MEMAHANLDTVWFTSPTEQLSDSEDDTEMDVTLSTDAFADDAKAKVSADAECCIAACSAWLDSNQGVVASIPNGKIVLENCNRTWRQVYHRWRAPCGNHFNVPDLLFVASCFLQVTQWTNPADRCLHCTDQSPVSYVRNLQAYINVALRDWDREPSILHAEFRVKLASCVRAVVFWGSSVEASHLVDTSLSPEDISLLTMNVNVHQNLDNRARSTDMPASVNTTTAAAVIAAVPVTEDSETLLGQFVRMASRYAFFASLHMIALCGDKAPCASIHRNFLTDNPQNALASDLMKRNVHSLRDVLKARRSVTLPDTMRREISYTIWKRLLSVGSIEVLCHS